MSKNEKSSKRLGTIASKVLKGNYSKDAKTLAASVLTQMPDKKKK